VRPRFNGRGGAAWTRRAARGREALAAYLQSRDFSGHWDDGRARGGRCHLVRRVGLGTWPTSAKAPAMSESR